VAFLLRHPVIANISCDACKKWVYDMETGKIGTYFDGSRDVPQPRPTPPPCKLGFQCPKISPEHESEFELCERNERMMRSFLSARATHGRSLVQSPDELACIAFRHLDSLFRDAERAESIEQILSVVKACSR